MDLIIFLRIITSSVAVIMLIYLGIDVLPVMTYEPGGGILAISSRTMTSSVGVIMLIYLGIDVLPVMRYEPWGRGMGWISSFF